MTTFILLFIPLLFIAIEARAQTDAELPAEVEEAVSQWSERESSASGDAEVLDELEEYRRRPIDLYTTTADALARLPGISLQDAIAILEFVEGTSPVDIAQLEGIASLTPEQLAILRSFTILPHRRAERAHDRSRVEIRTRASNDLQPRRGYIDLLRRTLTRRDPITRDSIGLDTIAIGSTYLGARPSFLARILVEHGDLSGGVTVEKDAGEPIIHDDTLAYDYARFEHVDPLADPGPIRRRIGMFLSAHATAQLGPVTVHLGDFSAEFGQGLLFGGRFGAFKGAGVIESPYRSARGITAYRSTGESGYYRGVAMTLNEGGWLPEGMSGGIFASYRSLDASLEEETEGEDSPMVASLREDGYRRTRGEIRGSGNLEERLFGMSVRRGFRSGGIGLTAYTTHLSMPLAAGLPQEATGRDLSMLSVDGAWRLAGIRLYGEIARGDDGSIGIVGGGMTRLDAIELVAAGRYLPARFLSLHGAPFGESPIRGGNERGLYIGLRAPIIAGLLLSAYLDLYDQPDRSTTVSFPRSGADGFFQIEYAPAGGIRLSARLRSEAKDDALTIEDTLGRARKRIVEKSATGGRIEATCQSPGGAIRLRGRFERRFIGYQGAIPASDGILTFLDLRYRPFSRLTFGMRLTLFDTDNYESAIYTVESDLPGISRSAPLSGEGRRFHLQARWHPSAHLSIAVRYAETVYADRTAISPGGPQQIDGPIDNEASLQVDLRF